MLLLKKKPCVAFENEQLNLSNIKFPLAPIVHKISRFNANQQTQTTTSVGNQHTQTTTSVGNQHTQITTSIDNQHTQTTTSVGNQHTQITTYIDNQHTQTITNTCDASTEYDASIIEYLNLDNQYHFSKRINEFKN